MCVSADVPSWLKSLRLHKYQHLFAELTYSEMLQMSEAFLKQKVSVEVPCLEISVHTFWDSLGLGRRRGGRGLSSYTCCACH